MTRDPLAEDSMTKDLYFPSELFAYFFTYYVKYETVSSMHVSTMFSGFLLSPYEFCPNAFILTTLKLCVWY